MLRFRIEPQTNSCISWTLQHKMQFSFLPHSKRKKERRATDVRPNFHGRFAGHFHMTTSIWTNKEKEIVGGRRR